MPAFVNSDFPNAPLLDIQNVLIHVEDSVHYRLQEVEAKDEWNALGVIGFGSVTYGPSHRPFYLPMFHQLHCLMSLRKNIVDGGSYERHKGHARHCLNYLREWILCQSDLTLETGDFMKRNFTWEKLGATHVCKDWNDIYVQTTNKWVEWVTFWAAESKRYRQKK